MPIDPSKALGAGAGRGRQFSYTKDEVILYHLGVGRAIQKPTDANELEYTYEKNLKVLPSFGVIPVLRPSMGNGIGNVPGLEFNFAMLLHGEQDLEIHQPIPPEATDHQQGQDRRDLGQGEGRAGRAPGGHLRRVRASPCSPTASRSSCAARVASVASRVPRPATKPPGARARRRDRVARRCRSRRCIYRLSGDKNPLHADPEFAKMGGFDTPIIARALLLRESICKAIVDDALGGDVTKVARYSGALRGGGLPGRDLS